MKETSQGLSLCWTGTVSIFDKPDLLSRAPGGAGLWLVYEGPKAIEEYCLGETIFTFMYGDTDICT